MDSKNSSSTRPIRIGNASGAIGDGIDQVYRLAKSGAVDAISADYLAEFNIAWKAIELQSRPDLGYEPNFLEQLAWENGDAARILAERRIKVNYAKQVKGNKMYGGQSTYIPMKVNGSGVMPIIFASAFMVFPQMIRKQQRRRGKRKSGKKQHVERLIRKPQLRKAI